MPFVRFGVGHLLAIAATAAGAVAAARLARRERWRPTVRWSLFALLAAAAAGFYAIEALNGTLSKYHLPFHLSDFAVFLALFALATLRRPAAELLYFLAIPAVIATVTPDLQRGFGDWFTWVFFVFHGGTVAAAAALTFGCGLAPRKGAVWRAMGFLLAYAALAALANRLLGTNFMFLSRKPRQPSPLDWLGEWPWYLAAASVLAAALFSLAYLPFAARERRARPNGKTAA
ncbi:MAG TPA: TIGR02206 family membrane protein [Longimicrobium sp.]|nr:TIGR02206 family membrane protein [Longimicrobium sp.]